MAHRGRARGEMGGGTREQCGSNKRCTGSPLKNLTTGRRGEVAHGGRARGEMGGGTREQCGSNKKVHCWAPLKT